MNDIKNEKIKKINSYIMALYIFQFGILQPICILFNSQIPVAIFTFCLLVIMVLNNGMKIKSYIIITFLIVTSLFLLNILIYQSNEFVLPMLFNYLFMGFSAFLIGSLDTDNYKLYKAFLNCSIINFFVLAPFPFNGLLPKIEYMRFGYAMLPSIIMMFYGSIYERKYKTFLRMISIIALILTLIYGSRGTLVSIIFAMILLFLFNKRFSKNFKISAFLLSIILLVIITRYNIVSKLLDYVYNNLEIKSYSLMKFMAMLNEGIVESSSGRGRIYSQLWLLFIENPIFGNGISVSQAMLGERITAHNMIIQILVEQGILGFLVWTLLWIYGAYKYNQISKLKENSLFFVVSMLISVSLGRLMVSSDLWARPEYWFVFSLLINSKSNNNL